MAVHLHVHSNFSFLEGLGSPGDLTRRAADWEMPALALTDHCGLSGAIEFYDACRQAGIQPGIGLELDVRPPPALAAATEATAGRLVLLAADLSGWSSLCRLSRLALTGEDGGRELEFAALTEHAAGLICLTGGTRGLCSQWLRRKHKPAARAWLEHLQAVFPGRLYVALSIHSLEDRGLAQALAVLAKSVGLPGVVAHPVYYLEAQQAALQRTLAAIRLNTPQARLPEAAVAPPQAHFLSPAELAERYRDFPEALERTREVAERCRLELPLGRPRFPAVALEGGETPAQALRRRAWAGAQRFTARKAQMTACRQQ
jgi:DNA polymerase-3 subunit alpha